MRSHTQTLRDPTPPPSPPGGMPPYVSNAGPMNEALRWLSWPTGEPIVLPILRCSSKKQADMMSVAVT